MKTFSVGADMGSVKVGNQDVSFFFANGYGDGEHRVSVCSKGDEGVERKVLDKMRFIEHFEVLRDNSVHLYSYDCGGKVLHSFERGRHFVYAMDGYVLIQYLDDRVFDNE